MIVRALAAAPDVAFDAWLDPMVMHRWMASAPGREIVAIDLAPRTGGDFTIIERAGAHDVRVCGRFDAVERPHHLELSLTDASGISLDIVPSALGCELRLVPRGARPDRWATMIDRLARLFA